VILAAMLCVAFVILIVVSHGRAASAGSAPVILPIVLLITQAGAIWVARNRSGA
jgi:hypothetical protein